MRVVVEKKMVRKGKKKSIGLGNRIVKIKLINERIWIRRIGKEKDRKCIIINIENGVMIIEEIEKIGKVQVIEK